LFPFPSLAQPKLNFRSLLPSLKRDHCSFVRLDDCAIGIGRRSHCSFFAGLNSSPVSRSPTVVPNLSTPQQQQSCNTTPTAQRFRSFFRCAHNVSLFSCSVPSLESRALLEGRPPISTISSFRNATTWAFRTIADLLQVILSERKHVGTPSTAGSLR